MSQQPWLPLTRAQQGLYFAQISRPDSPAWTTAEVVEIEGDLDPDLLGTAVATTHQEYEGLRTRFRSTPHGPEQQVDPDRVHPWSVVDVSAHRDPRASADQWLQVELARPMDPEAGDVVRSGVLILGPGITWWWHAAHHVVLDGFGVVQLMRRVAEHHAALARGESAAHRPVVELADLVADDQRVHAAETAAGAEEFWAARLADADEVVALAGRVADPAASHRRASMDVPDALQRLLSAGAKRLGVSWADLVQVAVGTLLARCTDAARTRIGVPLMNRSRPGDGQLAAAGAVCTAMNVLPATVLAGDTTWGDALAGFGREQLALREHPFLRQETLIRQLSRGAGGQLFGAQVNLVPFALELAFSPTCSGRVRNLTAGPVEDLTVCLRGVPGRGKAVRLELDAQPDLYDDACVAAHLERLLHWLEVCATADPATPVSELPLLPRAEWDRVVHGFNATDRPRQSATLAQRFDAQRARTPDAVAIIQGQESLSYRQVGRASDRLARALVAAGARTGDVVGVLLPRSIDLWVALAAVQRIGAVHLPLDAGQPAERISAMLTESGCGLVVAPTLDPALALSAGVTVLDVATSAPEVALPPLPTDVTAPAYLLFTSGSTGRPKGVLVQHEAIDNRLAWMQHQFPIGEGDTVLGKTPITFDVSVWEHFWPWQTGARVVVAGTGEHRDPRAIADLVVQHGVDVLHFVPSMLRAFLADRVAVGRLKDAQSDGVRVRHVICSGEALTADLVTACRDVFGVAPTNLYGPTEAAVDVTCQETERLSGAVVPIGRPVWNTACYVLDRHHNPLPVGMPGRLWLGGVQVALGYVNRPELTAERFTADPFRPGGRRYDTGDLACWTSDGTLLYLGRSDDQVKVRGQRVELGEIEAAVAGVPGVDGVVAGLVGQDLILWYRASSLGEVRAERASNPTGLAEPTPSSVEVRGRPRPSRDTNTAGACGTPPLVEVPDRAVPPLVEVRGRAVPPLVEVAGRAVPPLVEVAGRAVPPLVEVRGRPRPSRETNTASEDPASPPPSPPPTPPPATTAVPPDLITALREAAARVLPEGLRPSHYLEVTEIPLSVAGKVDRRRLRELTADLTTGLEGLGERGEGVAPDGLVEQRLCELFAAVLGRPVVAADSDFFELGGDSLKVLALLGEIEDTFGVTLQVRTLFATPTPTALAAAVERARSGEPSERTDAGSVAGDLAEVLTLRPGVPDIAPLVLLPPAGGLGWCYTALLRHLPREQEVVTIQAPGVETGVPAPVADLTALAERQLAALRSVIGDRPFHVAGWSLGGMAAHEVAALARAQGQAVGRVVVLDAYPSEQWSHLARPSEAEALVGILRLGGVEHLLATDADPGALDRAEVLELLRRGGSALAGLPEPALRGAIASVVEAAGVVRSSRHHRLPGDLDVVVATAPRPEHWLDPAGWRRHTTGEVRLHPVPCTHGELLRGDHAATVGTLLRTLLATSQPTSVEV